MKRTMQYNDCHKIALNSMNKNNNIIECSMCDIRLARIRSIYGQPMDGKVIHIYPMHESARDILTKSKCPVYG